MRGRERKLLVFYLITKAIINFIHLKYKHFNFTELLSLKNHLSISHTVPRYKSNKQCKNFLNFFDKIGVFRVTSKKGKNKNFYEESHKQNEMLTQQQPPPLKIVIAITRHNYSRVFITCYMSMSTDTTNTIISSWSSLSLFSFHYKTQCVHYCDTIQQPPQQYCISSRSFFVVLFSKYNLFVVITITRPFSLLAHHCMARLSSWCQHHQRQHDTTT